MMLTALFCACRSDIIIYPSESEQVAEEIATAGAMYLLCEGNMGSNKCTLDRLDLKTGQYTRNFYAAVNPTATKELGDVGNDLQVYGQKLWAVVNGSNKIEVMNAASGTRLGQVELANCRNITFHQGYAYATSYAGPIGTGHTQRGFVAKIDTASLSIVGTCLVGHQPNGLAVSNGQLFVANSGGYMAPNYERHLSVIDLYTFSVISDIDVAPNLNHVLADAYGQLWVSSHGDNSQPASLHCVDAVMRQVTATLPIGVNSMWLSGDNLYVTGFSQGALYGIVNVTQHQLLTDNFISDGSEKDIQRPYGICVHPTTGHIYVTDAKDYVIPGALHCYDRQGKRQWSVRTGDIPSCMAFHIGTTSGSTTEKEEINREAYANTVFEYHPAPGQFINILPTYEVGDTHESMCRKAEEAISGGTGGMVSLGGWGGFITLGFNHMVPNVAEQCDLRILGNAHYNSTDTEMGKQAGSAEPGIVQVSHDDNGNGLPDDKWYEIQGSHHGIGATKHYSITYQRPANPQADEIPWHDNQGQSGTIAHNTYHAQSYYPAWVDENQLTFNGTCLPSNAQVESVQIIFYSLDYGYADNHPNNSERSGIDIDWAVDENGQPAQLPGIHFVRIYTGINQQYGSLGEISTEVCGAIDLHYTKSFTNFVNSNTDSTKQ